MTNLLPFFKKAWEFIKYDILSTCVASLLLAMLFLSIEHSWIKINVFIPFILLGWLAYSVITIIRNGKSKELLNLTISDQRLRSKLKFNAFANRYLPVEIDLLTTFFLVIWIIFLISLLFIV